jgi:O-acetyl-ADP-ribose deacetylase (regulator of RNase III)
VPKPAQLRYVEGDATRPQGPGNKLICHCCNDIGGWGSGFVVALSKRWPQPEAEYRKWHAKGFYNGITFELGNVIYVPVEEEAEGSWIWVANIVGQHRTIKTGEKTPVRYEALLKGFLDVCGFCQSMNFSVHMPRIGAGLARGDWTRIEQIIQRVLVVEGGIDVSVYDLPGQPFQSGV